MKRENNKPEKKIIMKKKITYKHRPLRTEIKRKLTLYSFQSEMGDRSFLFIYYYYFFSILFHSIPLFLFSSTQFKLYNIICIFFFIELVACFVCTFIIIIYD